MSEAFPDGLSDEELRDIAAAEERARAEYEAEQEAADRVRAAAQTAPDRATDEVITNLGADSGRWLRVMADLEHEEQRA